MNICDTHIRAVLDLWGKTKKVTAISVHGQSMAPLLGEGDQILLDYDITCIRPGDILVFRQEETLVIHRVLRIIYKAGIVSQYITKGDNNFSTDLPVQPDQLIGRVILIQRANRVFRCQFFPWKAAGWVTAAIGQAVVMWVSLLHAEGFATRYSNAILFCISFLLRLTLLLSHPLKNAKDVDSARVLAERYYQNSNIK